MVFPGSPMTAVNETGFPETAVGQLREDYYEPACSQLTPAQALYRMLGIIIVPPGSPSVSTPQPEQPHQSFPPSPSSTSRLQQESSFSRGRRAGVSEKDSVPPPFMSGITQTVVTKAL